MRPQACSRMFSAAIRSVVDRGQCPHQMAAVDVLAQGFRSIGAFLDYLWKYSGPAENWPNFVAPTPEKQAAVLTITGKPWSYWTNLMKPS